MAEQNSNNRSTAGWGEMKKGYATDSGVLPPLDKGSASSSSSSISQSGSSQSSGASGSGSNNK
jgi:hypothetical protein